jgi:hypothetical protein
MTTPVQDADAVGNLQVNYGMQTGLLSIRNRLSFVEPSHLTGSLLLCPMLTVQQSLPKDTQADLSDLRDYTFENPIRTKDSHAWGIRAAIAKPNWNKAAGPDQMLRRILETPLTISCQAAQVTHISENRSGLKASLLT